MLPKRQFNSNHKIGTNRIKCNSKRNIKQRQYKKWNANKQNENYYIQYKQSKFNTKEMMKQVQESY